MRYLNEYDRKLAKLTNFGISFDVIRKEINANDQLVLYFLSSLTDSRSIFEMSYSLFNLDKGENMLQVLNGEIVSTNDINKAFIALSSGMSIIISKKCMYIVETRSYPSRGVNEPDTEKSIRGSKDGFNENIITNIGLIRRRIRSPNFVTKIVRVGNTSQCDISICALLDRVNENAMKAIEEKIKELNIDGLTMGDRALEERLFKQGFNPFPLVRYSERPDIVASHLLKGHIAIVVDNSSSVLIFPVTIFEHTKHIEEYRQVSIVGTFIRLIRYFSILISIFLVPIWMLTLSNDTFVSDIFVKINNPSNVPILAQILLVEFTIEVLRIATIHTPNQLTSAMGLIATLILGQMAVDIGWFASEVLLFSSISAIGGFATPSYELSLANKIVKVILILMVGLLGGSGFIIAIYLLIMFLGMIKIFDVPYFYPLFPFDYKELKKVIFRGISH